MYKKTIALTLGVLAMGATSALADSGPRIYKYSSSANYCPSGLQPITLNGVICCGTPNQSVSYQQAKAHPVTRTKRVRQRVRVRKASSRIVCPVGEKGCYSQ